MIRRLWDRLVVRRRESKDAEKEREIEEANRRLRALERFVAVKKAGR